LPQGEILPVPNAQQLRFEKLLNNLKDRFQFRDIAKILKEEDIGSASGWVKLLEKLSEFDSTAADRAEVVLNTLNSGLVLAGTKDAFIFPLDSAEVQTLTSQLTQIVVTEGNFSSAYPFSLDKTSLKPLTNEHELVRKEVHASGDISLILCAKRSEEDRVTYQYNQVTEAVQEAFLDFDEFVAIRRTDYQVFDVVTLRVSLQRIEVLVDQPTKIKQPETSEKRCAAILGRMSTMSAVIASIYEANSPLNLAPCISGMYHAPTEGRVSQLSFRTPTGSVNKGAVASQDLRTEVFHKSGVDAVGDVTPYDVTISWDLLVNARGPVSVQIGMPLSNLSSEACYVRHARIIGAREDAALVSVINKLVSYSSG
jgi:hypothetical protein